MPAIAEPTHLELLIAALSAGPAGERGLERLAHGPADLDDLVITALALGLAPLLHYRLEQAACALPDARAQAKLDFIRQAEVSRHAARQAQLAEVLARLPTHLSARPIVLKGAYLAEQVYPAPGLRPMNDIDLLFKPADLPVVSEVLYGLGYGAKDKPAEVGPGITKHTRTFQRANAGAATPNPYLSATGSRMVEPHRSLEEAWFGLRCDLTPGMWERSFSTLLAGQPARVLNPADALLHLCVHLTYHLIQRSPSFVQLVDVAVYASRVPVDWDDWLARARVLGASGYAYAAARLAVETLAAPIPPTVVRALAAQSPARVRRVAETLSLADVMRRTQAPPLRGLRQRLLRGVTDRAETSRWAHSSTEWLRVWRTLVDVSRTDTWRQITNH
jgi:hypothetical protein